MKKKLKKLLKNQKGLTLVELLAVVVILGIIAAIAVPSIANIIDNSKKDAHVANAEQLVGAARLAVAANDTAITGDNSLTMEELVKNGYLESDIEDPDKAGNPYSEATVTLTINSTTKNTNYKVYLKGDKRGIGTSGSPLEISKVTRASVK
ncbi:prepilin-type N-terminal cleavage/methylation domain-containing protein [Peribacillus asahii]|uniref:Prepilin-type N-terminal cleavage/methylation domain-containing protein n=1 Tax=Peribacillus asahii TaxID=228899 RepID=A0A398BHR8_9BACI|nr:type II secretion system protein [Peribacillus asahii]RID88168.1 prepilin-type N-terminal cleavage/methylation domain-containing protein [Peribacillus asahii]